MQHSRSRSPTPRVRRSSIPAAESKSVVAAVVKPTIISAVYGDFDSKRTVDVKDIVQGLVNKHSSGALELPPQGSSMNGLFTDPAHGVVKTFKVTYQYPGGKPVEETCGEYSGIVLASHPPSCWKSLTYGSSRAGTFWNDFDVIAEHKNVRITKLSGTFGGFLNGLQVTYQTSEGKEIVAPLHYGNYGPYAHPGSGTTKVVTLEDHEFITNLNIHAGDIIDGIVFTTNLGKTHQFGGNGGIHYDIHIPNGHQLLGFYGFVQGVICRLGAFTSANTDLIKSTIANEYLNNFKTVIPTLYGDESLADVTVQVVNTVEGKVVEGKSFKAHKLILGLGSPVLRPMLADFDLKTPLRISGYSDATVQQFIKLFYTGRIDIDEKNLSEMISIAKKHDAQLLINQINAYLSTGLTVESAHDLFKTNGVGLDFLAENAAAYIEEKSFLSLTIEQLTQFAQSDKLSISEVNLFKAILKWGTHAESDEAKRKALLAPALNHVRFPLMTQGELSTVVPSGVLDPADIIALFTYVSTKKVPDKFKYKTTPRSGSAAAAAAAAPAAAAAAPVQVQPEPEEDRDMGYSLFD